MSEIEQVTLSMDGFEVNSYVIHAPEGDIIVDAGAEPEKILGATRAPVAAILVTHGHADHIDALEFVRRETGAPVYMHPADAEGKVGTTSRSKTGARSTLRALVSGSFTRRVTLPGRSRSWWVTTR